MGIFRPFFVVGVETLRIWHGLFETESGLFFREEDELP
jgi:hypothetical protein